MEKYCKLGQVIDGNMAYAYFLLDNLRLQTRSFFKKLIYHTDSIYKMYKDKL